MICGYPTDILTDKKFDVITIWDVIEHVEEPIKLLKSAMNYINLKIKHYLQFYLLGSLLTVYTA